MVNGNQALIEGAYEAFGRGDIPAVLGILSNDVEWDVPDVLPHGRHAHGPGRIPQATPGEQSAASARAAADWIGRSHSDTTRGSPGPSCSRC